MFLMLNGVNYNTVLETSLTLDLLSMSFDAEFLLYNQRRYMPQWFDLKAFVIPIALRPIALQPNDLQATALQNWAHYR